MALSLAPLCLLALAESLVGTELAAEAMMAGQQAPEIWLCPLPLPTWECRSTWHFYLVIQLRTSCLYGKLLNCLSRPKRVLFIKIWVGFKNLEAMWRNVVLIYKSVKPACVLFPFTHGTSENKTTSQWPGVSTENAVFPGYLRDWFQDMLKH